MKKFSFIAVLLNFLILHGSRSEFIKNELASDITQQSPHQLFLDLCNIAEQSAKTGILTLAEQTIFQRILNVFKPHIHHRNDEYRTLIDVLALLKHPGLLSLIFEDKKIIQSTIDWEGRTSLHHACDNSIVADPQTQLKTIKKILNYTTVDVNAQDNYKMTALQLFLFSRMKKIAEIKADRFIGNPEHFSILEILLDYGSNPNVPNNRGITALHYCIQQGNEREVKLLLEFDADPTQKNTEGASTLDMALAQGVDQILDELNWLQKNRTIAASSVADLPATKIISLLYKCIVERFGSNQRPELINNILKKLEKLIEKKSYSIRNGDLDKIDFIRTKNAHDLSDCQKYFYTLIKKIIEDQTPLYNPALVIKRRTPRYQAPPSEKTSTTNNNLNTKKNELKKLLMQPQSNNITIIELHPIGDSLSHYKDEEKPLNSLSNKDEILENLSRLRINDQEESNTDLLQGMGGKEEI